jgi:hypothetical protein
MKKIIISFILIAIIATGTVFADHPKGFGIGTNFTFEGVSENYGTALGYGITLKTPYVPVFIGAKFFFNYTDYTVMTFNADYYIFDMPLIKDLKLDWYAGLGFDYQYYNNSVNNYVHGIGLRVPIGISFYVTEKIEFFFEVAPTPYFGITPHDSNAGVYTPVGIGMRFYLQTTEEHSD